MRSTARRAALEINAAWHLGSLLESTPYRRRAWPQRAPTIRLCPQLWPDFQPETVGQKWRLIHSLKWRFATTVSIYVPEPWTFEAQRFRGTEWGWAKGYEVTCVMRVTRCCHAARAPAAGTPRSQIHMPPVRFLRRPAVGELCPSLWIEGELDFLAVRVDKVTAAMRQPGVGQRSCAPRLASVGDTRFMVINIRLIDRMLTAMTRFHETGGATTLTQRRNSIGIITAASGP